MDPIESRGCLLTAIGWWCRRAATPRKICFARSHFAAECQSNAGDLYPRTFDIAPKKACRMWRNISTIIEACDTGHVSSQRGTSMCRPIKWQTSLSAGALGRGHGEEWCRHVATVMNSQLTETQEDGKHGWPWKAWTTHSAIDHRKMLYWISDRSI